MNTPPIHTPKFAMPVILPDLTATDYGIRYQEIIAQNRLTVAKGAQESYTLSLKGADIAEVLAVGKGWVTFIPPGENLPEFQTVTAGEGALVLQLALGKPFDFLQKALPDQPIYAKVLYNHIDKAGSRALLRALLLEQPLKSIQIHIGNALKPESYPLPAAFVDAVLDKVFKVTATAGEPHFSIVVQALDRIGKAGTTQAPDTRSVTLVYSDIAGVPSSPLPFWRALGIPFPATAPVDERDKTWVGHPLYAQTLNLASLTRIYLRLEYYMPAPVIAANIKLTENDPIGEIVPLPVGTPVHLRGLPTDSPELHTTVGPLGAVIFEITDFVGLLGPQVGTLPDLYFETDLSAQSNLPPGMPTIWKSKGWKNMEERFVPPPGFLGGQLGTADQPMVFRIGFSFPFGIQIPDGGSRSQKSIPTQNSWKSIYGSQSGKLKGDWDLLHQLSRGIPRGKLQP